MQLLHAGILHNPAHPCVGCAAPSGTCWCGPLGHNPRHDEAAIAGPTRLMRTRARITA